MVNGLSSTAEQRSWRVQPIHLRGSGLDRWNADDHCEFGADQRSITYWIVWKSLRSLERSSIVVKFLKNRVFHKFSVVYELLSQSFPIFPRYVCINNTITHYRSLSYTKLVLVLIVVIIFPTCIGSYLIQPPPIQPQSTPAMLNSDVLSRVRKGKVKIPFPSSLQEVPNWLHLHLIDHFCTVAQSSHDTQRTDLAK